MKHLPNGNWLCPRCKGEFTPDSPSLPKDKHNPCNSCGTAYKMGWRHGKVVNYVKPATRRNLDARAAARRKLEELADRRSVEF